MEWLPIEALPDEMKDGRYIVALVTKKLERLGPRYEHYAGRAFVIRHEGVTRSGHDMGWAVYPGFGGVADDYFDYWQPLAPWPS